MHYSPPQRPEIGKKTPPKLTILPSSAPDGPEVV